MSVELLERRLSPATIIWSYSGSGNWGTASNWNLDRVPTTGDYVDIPTLSAATAITFSSSTTTVDSITSGTNLILSGGTLNVLGNIQMASGSVLTLQGGTLGDATVSGGSTVVLTSNGGALTDVTVASGATVDGTQPSFGNMATIANGFTLNGTMDLGATNGSTYAQVTFQDSQTLGGTGTVVFGGSTNNAIYAEGRPGQNTPAALTIGSGITIQGGSGSISGYYNSNYYSNSNVFDSIVNNAATTTVGSGQSFAFSGLTSTTGSITANGAALKLSGTNWVNSGTIIATGGAVMLGGSFATGSLGSFTATGATVNLTAMLTNTGTTLALAPALGNWYLDGGTINGGTISSTGGATLALTPTGGTIAGGVVIAASVTIDGTQQLP